MARSAQMIETVTPESVGMSSSRLRRVDAWLEAQVANERLAGASVLIGRRGQQAYFGCAGRADIDAGTPFTDDTVKAVVHRMKEMGVLSSSIGTAFEMAPPLISERGDLDRATEVTAKAVSEIATERGFA
jgi:adenosylmethionine-8-amino-7-oxononanoate aminotransferase